MRILLRAVSVVSPLSTSDMHIPHSLAPSRHHRATTRARSRYDQYCHAIAHNTIHVKSSGLVPLALVGLQGVCIDRFEAPAALGDEHRQQCLLSLL